VCSFLLTEVLNLIIGREGSFASFHPTFPTVTVILKFRDFSTAVSVSLSSLISPLVARIANLDHIASLLLPPQPGMWKLEAEAVKFVWKQKHFKERSWKRKRTRKHLTFEEPKAEAFFIKHGEGMWKW